MKIIDTVSGVLFSLGFRKRLEKEVRDLTKMFDNNKNENCISETKKINIYRTRTGTGIWTTKGDSQEIHIRNYKMVLLGILYSSYKKRLESEGFNPNGGNSNKNIILCKRWLKASRNLRNLLEEEYEILQFSSLNSYIVYITKVEELLTSQIARYAPETLKKNYNPSSRVTRKIKQRKTRKYN